MANKLIVYGHSGCGHCINAKKFMTQEGIPHTFIDLANPANDAFRKKIEPEGAVPKICREDDSTACIIGFNADAVRKLAKK